MEAGRFPCGLLSTQSSIYNISEAVNFASEQNSVINFASETPGSPLSNPTALVVVAVGDRK